MLYLVYRNYTPNTASINRAFSYWNNIEKCDIEATVIFLMPNSNKNRVAEGMYKKIKFIYMWDSFYINLPIVNGLSFILYVFKLYLSLKKEDVIYLYGLSDVLTLLSMKKGIKLYQEVTEHPAVSHNGNRLYRPSITSHIKTVKKISGLIVISKSLKEYYASKGVNADCIHVINMTIDIERFHNIKKQNNIDKNIAYCGSMSNKKDGVDNLIKAFAIVTKKHHDVKLYIIGPKPSIDNENLKLIDSLGIREKVIFTGEVSSVKMPQLLKNSTVLALARPNNIQAQYGFPTKLGEYLLSENPVVITKVGDIPLYLNDRKNALLADPGNIEEFAEKLCWVLEHPKESEIIGINGKDTALKIFNASIETKKLLNVLLGKKYNN